MTKRINNGNNTGLKPKDRKLAKPKNGKLVANQWQGTPQQNEFMAYWLEPDSETFGNAYKSAIKAKYSNHYAMIISSPTVNNKWLSEYIRRLNLTEDHIKAGISQLALKVNDSRSPDDTRLKAYEILAKITGMIDNKSGVTNNILVQPILGGNSVKPEVVSEQ